MNIQKVSLIGLGAMGSFFAVKLHPFLGEGNFRVIAEGERKQRLCRDGVTINGVTYHFTVKEPKETGDVADLVIIAVKDTQLDQAISDIKNQVGPHTQILSVLNGVDSEKRVAEVYGWERVLYSYMRVSIVMQNGKADFNPNVGKVHFGEAQNKTLSDRVKRIARLFDASGVGYEIDEDMILGMWFKYMCNIGENMTCALLGVPFGAFQKSSYANEIRIGAMKEVIQIANRLNIPLSDAHIDKQEEVIQKLPFHNKPSTLQDLDNKRKTEVEMFSGKILKLGKELGIDTPINRMLYNGIRVLEEKNEGMFIK